MCQVAHLEVGGLPDGARKLVREHLDEVRLGGVPIVEDVASNRAARVLHVTLDQAHHQ